MERIKKIELQIGIKEISLKLSKINFRHRYEK